MQPFFSPEHLKNESYNQFLFDISFSDVDDVKVDKTRTEEFMQIFQILKAYAGDVIQLPDALFCLETSGRVSFWRNLWKVLKKSTWHPCPLINSHTVFRISFIRISTKS